MTGIEEDAAAQEQPGDPAEAPEVEVDVYDELVAAISLVEITMRSLEAAEVGAPEQISLKLTLEKLWSVHDALDALDIFSGDDDDDS